MEKRESKKKRKEEKKREEIKEQKKKKFKVTLVPNLFLYFVTFLFNRYYKRRCFRTEKLNGLSKQPMVYELPSFALVYYKCQLFPFFSYVCWLLSIRLSAPI